MSKRIDRAQMQVERSWAASPAALADCFCNARRQQVLMAVRIGIASLIILGAVAPYVLRLAPGIPVAKVICILAGLCAFQVGLLLLGALATRTPRSTIEYAIGDRGLRVPSRDHPLIQWKNIDSFTLEPHPRLPGLAILGVHRKHGTTRWVMLPEDSNEVRAIGAAMSRHIPERPPLPKYAPLAKAHWLLGIAAVVAWCVACALVPLNPLHLHISRDTARLLVQLPMLIGPGTLAALFLIGRRGFHQLFSFAITMNLLAWVSGALILVIRAALFVAH